jgi:hypothetical protein
VDSLKSCAVVIFTALLGALLGRSVVEMLDDSTPALMAAVQDEIKAATFLNLITHRGALHVNIGILQIRHVPIGSAPQEEIDRIILVIGHGWVCGCAVTFSARVLHDIAKLGLWRAALLLVNHMFLLVSHRHVSSAPDLCQIEHLWRNVKRFHGVDVPVLWQVAHNTLELRERLRAEITSRFASHEEAVLPGS